MKNLAAVIALIVLGIVVWVLWPGEVGIGETRSAEEQQVASQLDETQKTATPLSTPALPGSNGFWLEPEPEGTLRLEGLVLDQIDQPLEKVSVSVDTAPPRTTISDRGGAFLFDGLVGRRYMLIARQGSMIGGPVRVKLSETSDPVVIRLRSGGMVEVSAVAKESRSPVVGALVELRGICNLSGKTNKEGKVTIQGVPSGNFSLVVKAPGFATAFRSVDVPPQPAGPQQVRVSLKRGSAVTGRVFNENGDPIIKATVLAVDTAALVSRAKVDRDGAHTDSQGQFELTALAPGTYRINAFHLDYQTASSNPFTVSSSRQTGNIDLVMKAGTKLTGKVIDADGQPVSWARVRCAKADRSPFFGSFIDGTMGKATTADEGGFFSFSDLPRVRISLLAFSEDALSDIQSIDLQSSSAVGDVILRLKASKGISGVVVDSSGEPVHDAQVIASPDSLASDSASRNLRRTTQTFTDGGGNFTFRNLAKGIYRLRASRSTVTYEQSLQSGVLSETGDEGVRLVVPGTGGIIKGRLSFTDGSNPSWFSIAFGRPPGIPVNSDDGSFEIGGVPPGTHFVFISGKEFSHVVLKNIEIQEDQITDVGLVQVERGRKLSGMIVDSLGSAVQGATVLSALGIMSDGSNLLTDSGSGSDEVLEVRRTVSGPDGSFVIDGVGSGSRVLIAEHEERGRSEPVTIQSGTGPEKHVLVLKGFGSLIGDVTLGRKSVASAQISAYSKGTSKYTISVQAGEDGGYLISKLAAGMYSVGAEVRDVTTRNIRSASREVTIHENDKSRLDIDIPVGQITLTVNVTGMDGAVINLAPVHLVQGVVQASTVEDLNSIKVEQGGINTHSFWTPARPAYFKNLPPGRYTLCVAPLKGDIEDQAFVMWMKKNLSRLKVHCSTLLIESAPPIQNQKVSVPGMEFL